MRITTVLIVGLLVCTSARAQVSFDPRALNQLKQPAANAPSGAAPASPPAASPRNNAPAEKSEPRASRPTRPQSTRPQSTHPQSARAPTSHARPTAARSEPSAVEKPEGEKAAPPSRAGKPAVKPPVKPPVDARRAPAPTTPPPGVVLPPPTAVPVRPSPPPPPAPVIPSATGAVSGIEHGARLTFGGGSSDLNPETDAAIKTAVHGAPPGDATTFTVTAYAAGTPEDPSTARRLALSRALAVRSVLIAEGVASIRIYVKALGSNGPEFAAGPPDRVDLTVATPPPASQQKLP